MPTVPKTDIIRTEEWQVEVGPMISTLVVRVHTGDVVWVDSPIVKELRLDPAASKEVVPPGMQKFTNEFPYEVVKSALIEAGFSYVSAT